MDRVITVEASRPKDGKQSKYAIVFDGAKIDEFINLPNDYNISEFIEIIQKKAGYNSPFESVDVVYDNRGFGVVFDDQFDCSFNSKPKDTATYLDVAKSSLIEIAINSSFDHVSKIEFLKLTKELNNMSIEVGTNGSPKVKFIDEKLGRTRAYCYLLYFNTPQGQSHFMVDANL